MQGSDCKRVPRIMSGPLLDTFLPIPYSKPYPLVRYESITYEHISVPLIYRPGNGRAQFELFGNQ